MRLKDSKFINLLIKILESAGLKKPAPIQKQAHTHRTGRSARPGRSTHRLNRSKKDRSPSPKQTQTEGNIKKGTVKFFNQAKGFGFIKTEAEEEVFVHVSGLKDDIRKNDEVTFELEHGKKGLSAVNVVLI